MTYQKMRMANCHTDKKYFAKGFCKVCYNKNLRKINPKYNASCCKISMAWARKNPKIRGFITRKHRYNISREDYVNLIKSQNNLCKICKAKPSKHRSLCIDHCHKTLKIRGLLCDKCNTGLANFKDNIILLQNAIDYLNEKK